MMFSLSNRDIFTRKWSSMEDAKQSDDGSERVSKKSATGQCGATVGVLTPIKKRTEVLKFFGGQKLL